MGGLPNTTSLTQPYQAVCLSTYQRHLLGQSQRLTSSEYNTYRNPRHSSSPPACLPLLSRHLPALDPVADRGSNVLGNHQPPTTNPTTLSSRAFLGLDLEPPSVPSAYLSILSYLTQTSSISRQHQHLGKKTHQLSSPTPSSSQHCPTKASYTSLHSWLVTLQKYLYQPNPVCLLTYILHPADRSRSRQGSPWVEIRPAAWLGFNTDIQLHQPFRTLVAPLRSPYELTYTGIHLQSTRL